MSHWAEINETGLVLRVLVGDNNEPDYNGNIRKNYAGIGYTYDAVRDAFIAPKPDNATGFDETTCRWIVPDDGNQL
jgi:hypothetical protein